MSQSANVLSVAALEELRAAMVAFAAAAKEVLYSVESEIRRSGDWLEEQLHGWQNEVRRCEDAVFEARQELARRRMIVLLHGVVLRMKACKDDFRDWGLWTRG